MASLQEQQDMTELAVDPAAYSSTQPTTKNATDTHDYDTNDTTNTDYGNDEEDHEESKIPLDIVRLTLLMVSGKRYTYDFRPSTSILDVKKHIIQEWPQEWGSNTIKSLQHIELLYLGKFLSDSSTLESNRLHGGDSFTVHLLIREHQTKSVEDANDTESKSRCKCCIIL
ncbi:hypothetical protein LRAMOSA11177 [Lichtheimia ramosa]|uniref:Ubiquitin-like domain-containing protein n=1 Tax=Lichtheimia ramosa TaxID=688394 RepID=A0A077WSY2_9FUNG|nr:hypothetical protein LRAMOSA11177 [Lichtheimia ramosa]